MHCTSTDDRPRISVLLAEDEALLREILPVTLHSVSAGQIAIVGTCANRSDLLRQSRRLAPDVVLLDLRMPNSPGAPPTLDGAGTITRLSRVCPSTVVICLSSNATPTQVKSCHAAGCQGFLTKSSVPTSIIEAIRTVHAGTPYFPAALSAMLATVAPKTHAEQLALLNGSAYRDLVALFVEGKSAAEIAADLSITVAHVNKQLARLRRALHVATPVALYKRCQELGVEGTNG